MTASRSELRRRERNKSMQLCAAAQAASALSPASPLPPAPLPALAAAAWVQRRRA